MLLFLVLAASCLFLAAAAGDDFNPTQCDAPCDLPDCFCGGQRIPGGLAVDATPQFIVLTFDDSVTPRNMRFYREVLHRQRNKQGCPVVATFFVDGSHTKWDLVKELHRRGSEIASHTRFHRYEKKFYFNRL